MLDEKGLRDDQRVGVGGHSCERRGLP
jgi:hypothetical protein